jgi:hypothetical protein
MNEHRYALLLAFAICFLFVQTVLAQPVQGRAADRKLPSKFVGHWCDVKSTSGQATYERGSAARCSPEEDGGWMIVNVNGYRSHETDCKVLSAAAISSGNYQVKFKCSGEGETWTQNFRMSMDNRGRLVMRE